MVKNLFANFLQIFINFFSKSRLVYVVEPADWSIKHDGLMVTSNLKYLNSRVTSTPFGARNSIVHYGSINTFFKKDKLRLPHRSNKIVVTWFHVVPNDERIKLIPKALKYVELWHTSCKLTKNKMVLLGIPKEKIIVIPIGVELGCFKKPSLEEKEIIKKDLGIPNGKIVIGSFQKDGNGWGEGLEPKFIKGPDIFCDVLEKLIKRYEIFVLLTGPARGYVKRRLEKANIPYRHDFLKMPNEVAKYFQAIDLYIITSREEGGPKALLECMASGVPIVSTKVGMAPDIISDCENGFLVDIENVNMIYKRACDLIEDKELQKRFSKNGLKYIKGFDWKDISGRYYKRIYKELL